MIALTDAGLVALVTSAFTTGAHWAVSYYRGSKNSNGTKAMGDWQRVKDREIIALQLAIQANTVAVAALNSTVEHGVLPRLMNLEREG
jgi:hypothetical protein